MGFQESEAEELVQDTFAAFLQAIERFEERSTLKSFLFGILYHKAQQMWRRQSRQEPVENIDEIFESWYDPAGAWKGTPDAPEALIETNQFWDVFDRCADRLALSQRTAFYLKEVQREPTESVCKIMDISVTHLGVLLYRARNRLRECMKKGLER